MHITVTDRLACPACGPEAGLVLLADRLENRRVLEGWLGCASCRRRYVVRGGFADLREPAGDAMREATAPVASGAEGPGLEANEPDTAAPRGIGYAAGADAREAALRLGGLLSPGDRPGGLVLLTGASGEYARELASLLDGIEVLTSAPALALAGEVEGVSRLGSGDRLPLFTRSMRGVVADLRGAAEPERRLRMEEAVRVAAPTARVLVEAGEWLEEAERMLEELGLRVLAKGDGAVLGVVV